jgi:branched-subunit amino acid permease
MKVMTAKSSLNLGVVPPPPLSHVKMLLDERSFLCLHEVLALCMCKLGSLLSGVVLYLASLTTTHGDAGLLTSTAQQGGLREVGA